MKKFVLLVIMFCTVMISSTASAARGVVAFYNQSSRKIVIATQMGYTCGKLMDFPIGLNKGDVVAGDLESFGTHEIYNLTDDENFSIWIDNYWLSEDRVIDWLERGY